MRPLLLLLLGCSPSAVPIGSVAEAVDHPEAARFALAATSVKEALGVAAVDTPGGRREIWVVPVRDVDAVPGSEVALWVTPPALQEVGASPEIWYAQLADRFDAQARTWPVAGRASDAAADPVVQAIRAAESAHGLRSLPGAPVIFGP